MFGLKNLISKGVLNDDSYGILRKKSDQYRRSVNFFTGHIHRITEVYHKYYQLLENQISDTSSELQKSENANQQLFVDIVRMFCGMNGELRKFVEKEVDYEDSLNKLCKIFMDDYNGLVDDLQAKSRQYFESEQNVIENCKKYFGAYKEMMAKIEAYKNSFMDVKLIYNTEEKLKLYNECLQNYRRLLELARLIQIKVKDLNIRKEALKSSYQLLPKNLETFVVTFASKYIEQLKKFYEGLFKFQRNRLQIFSQRMTALENSPFPSFFETDINLSCEDLITVPIDPQACRYLPSMAVYYSKLSPSGVNLFRRYMVVYLNEMTARADKRRRLARKMVEFAKEYLSGLQKSLNGSIKETLYGYEKMRRNIGTAFGTRWTSFYKIISVIFENCLQNTGRLMLRTLGIIQNLQNYINSESTMMGQFLKELRAIVEQKVHRKIIKLYNPDKHWKTQPLINEEKGVTQQQIYECSISITDLVEKYNKNGAKMYEQGRNLFISFISELKQSLTEYFTFFNEIQNTYYDQEQYAKSYQMFLEEISSSIQNGIQFFQEIPLSALLKQTAPIAFDGQFNKLQGFKKLKKPKELEQLQLDNLRLQQANAEQAKAEPVPTPIIPKINNQNKPESKDVFLGEINSRHANFLMKKITLQEGQKYVKSYSCSFSDKIILAGRLFLTTNRICFYSKFNSSNLFFGETFIKIPKADVTKVQKRAMSMISDHAIEISTKNGSMVFRSFFSRDNAYNLIRKTLDINSEEIFFVQDQNADNDNLIQQQLEFEDDLKEEASKEREEKLAKKIQEWDYTALGQQELTFPGLTVVKYLKLFELEQEVVVNRTNYSSFLHYFKDFTQCTEVSIENWNPNPLQHLNVVNIKEDASQAFTRQISAVVPLPPSGIPFMPKTSLTTEDQTMHLLTGNKVVIESVIRSKGVPYCQTFDVRFKKVIESAGENKVKISAFVFSNFNQKVMVQGTINDKTIESTRESVSKQNEEIRSYLKLLEKKLSKGNKKQTPQDKIKEQEEIIAELEGKIKEQKEELKHTKEECSGLKQKVKLVTIVAGVFLVIFILETILLLS